jgi:hypothetical protein
MNRIVVQLNVDTNTDFDQLLHVEETLTRSFGLDDLADVDGHDLGEGRFNIFVRTSGPWEPVLARVKGLLERLGVLSGAVIAKLHADTQSYEVVHPDSYAGEFSL